MGLRTVNGYFKGFKFVIDISPFILDFSRQIFENTLTL